MMSAVQYALAQIRNKIPGDILNTTFIQPKRFRNVKPLSLDYIIRDKIINGRITQDLNLVGGQLVTVLLDNVPREIVDPWTVVYRIPKRLTMQRSIIHVLSVSFGNGAIMGVTNMGPTQGNTLIDTATNVLNSNLQIPQVSTAQATLVGDNVVMIADNIALPLNLYLRCWVEHHPEFSNLKPTQHIPFGKMVVLATKAYIYINNIIPMDRAYIFSGADLGRLKEEIEKYSDADEQYETFRDTTWRKVMVLSDYPSKRRFSMRAVGGGY